MQNKKNNLRVLMVGAGEFYHIEPLARCIKKASNNCTLEISGLYMHADDGHRIYAKSSKEFNLVHQLPEKFRKNKQSSMTSHKTGAIMQSKTQSFCIMGLRIVYHAMRSKLRSITYKKHFDKLLKNIDIVHLQSIYLSPAFYWLLADPKKPVVVSCWGSDVLRMSDLPVTYLQMEVLNMATVITVTGIEFKEIILAKYGRQLESKIVNTYFNPGVEQFLNHNEKRRYPKTKERKKVWRVCIGHNGNKDGNHRALIKSMSGLPSEIKEKIELIIPMTYGAHGGYCEEIKELCINTGYKAEIYEKFMTNTEVIEMRLATDILIFAPISDAFSATVTQAFAVGNVVVVGAWLPYKTRKISGFKFHEILTPSDGGLCIQNIIGNWEEECAIADQNRMITKEIFSEKAIGADWLDGYRLAMEKYQGKKSI